MVNKIALCDYAHCSKSIEAPSQEKKSAPEPLQGLMLRYTARRPSPSTTKHISFSYWFSNLLVREEEMSKFVDLDEIRIGEQSLGVLICW